MAVKLGKTDYYNLILIQDRQLLVDADIPSENLMQRIRIKWLTLPRKDVAAFVADIEKSFACYK